MYAGHSHLHISESIYAIMAFELAPKNSIVTLLLLLIVGNKNDDPERKVVETEDAYKFAGQMGIQLFETSAKENVNVEEVRGIWGRAGGGEASSSQAKGPAASVKEVLP